MTWLDLNKLQRWDFNQCAAFLFPSNFLSLVTCTEDPTQEYFVSPNVGGAGGQTAYDLQNEAV